MSRSIADQSVEELGGPGSVLVRQRRDHVQLDRLLHELGGTTGRAQEEVLTRIDRLVFSHAFAEESVLWPVMRRVLPDGEELTLRIEKEHQEVNELVSELETLGHDDPRRAQRLSRLVEVLNEDVRDEEDVLFPRLQERLDPHELRALGRRWDVVRRISPTRPHPTVSRRPPGNALSALPLSVLDRSRDVVDAAVCRAPARLAPVGRLVSQGLAGLAGLVERTPPARRGDRPPTSR
ncbi:hemerythrin domain-containing protein [Geodermatophilus obscurus]|uniref:Hemerythrin HHE cation binding domain protein n=1 Tax=Geodermatophilus obscurus (strain ATCC 25078 / DSM 43160 / JCM 3152 / CCUG 61914 / KCC A-0152 / KCTC 9177 / NBRC 13315 / NRRL B-3577 / G-20) TaxID=526225 RepID=D2S4S7_GEOOG|nr:hemerythrin domain-containing protein [Geodermatophilus obscurus]ADB77227.1 Hemerythrin HHE cation binding domain protein [Geodermatophilus obscurus DSM 43160]